MNHPDLPPVAASAAPLTVYFDGACPLCRREIATYRRMRGADQLAWVDVSDCGDAELGEDLTARAAMARMHVRQADGTLIDGAAAFAEILAHLPKTHWVGRVARTRPVLWVLEPAYTVFLRVRPLWRGR